MPAGFFIAASKHWRLGWVAAAIGAPIFAETWQHWIPALLRLCHVPDIQDNYQGVLIGILVGFVAVGMKYLVRGLARLK